jgi:glycosyltransferase involved in cell wall biosynthesis
VKVVGSFKENLPTSTVYVFDNNSTDKTAQFAVCAGAELRKVSRQGKGYVVRQMFSDVEADIYVLVDGDDTYDPKAAPRLIELMRKERLDFLNAARVSLNNGAYRTGHRFGNAIINIAVQTIFGREFSDMLSGYKLFSRRYVKSFPAVSSGFEIETELTIHALELKMPCAEVNAIYSPRPTGSASKLRTIPDGVRIAGLILRLVRDERPLAFFTILSSALFVIGIALGIPVIAEYFSTGLVPRLPTAVLSAGIMLLSAMSFFAGLTLDLVTKTRREIKRLAYLAAGPPR